MATQSFDNVPALALRNKGSAKARRLFQSGFSWSVVENKWPACEVAFEGFDLTALRSDPRSSAKRLPVS